ncbi:MAG: RsmE family RNA methyltransferase [Candidatus Omnitrophota bacterium]|jgi:16S rRNA (uracil1498-N3)-methyltransferase
MQRIFSLPENIAADTIVIPDKKSVHYIRDVLRLRPGGKINVFDGRGNEYDCLVGKLSEDKVVLKIENKSLFSGDNRVKFTIACAIPKKAKMDEIIDKLTQLGVERIIPILTERVVVKLDKQKKTARTERWKKIAKSASEQSQRVRMPVIDPISDIEEVLSGAGGFDLKLIPTLLGERKPLKDVLPISKPAKILVLIGPEGDFTPEEVKAAVKTGCVPVSLGNLVLRVDTAAIAIAAYLTFSS